LLACFNCFQSPIHNLLSELNDQGGYFIDFISTRGIQAGIIRLHPGENDTEEPHSVAYSELLQRRTSENNV